MKNELGFGRNSTNYFSLTEKECSSCRKIKPHSDFHKDNNKYKLAYYCKICASDKGKNWFSINKENTKETRRNSGIKSRHGITLEEYKDRLDKQNYVCAICGVKLTTSGHGTHLDHCHKTGRIRAFLCTNCNRGLGHFHDSIDNLQKAINYLYTHSTNVDRTEVEEIR